MAAYVDLGMPDQVAAHAALAMEEFESSESSWSKSLIRLDLANSLALAGDGDPDEASSYVTAALNFSAEKPIASVVQRSRSFARATARWRDIPAVDDAHELVRRSREITQHAHARSFRSSTWSGRMGTAGFEPATARV